MPEIGPGVEALHRSTRSSLKDVSAPATGQTGAIELSSEIAVILESPLPCNFPKYQRNNFAIISMF